MPLKLIETSVSETAVRVRYADDPAAPDEWLDFQVKVQDLKLASGKPMQDPNTQAVGAVQIAVLRHALAVTTSEIDRIRDLLSHIP